MKISLQRRIQISFYLSIALVASIGAISFYYINLLNDEVQQIVTRDIGLTHSSEKIKSSFFSLRRVERTYLLDPNTPLFLETMQTAINDFRKSVEDGQSLSVREETKAFHKKILPWLDEYEAVVKDVTVPFNPRLLAGSLDIPARKIQSAVASIAELRYKDLEAHRQDARMLSDASNRNMLLVIVITILAGLAVGFFAPSKVVLPFRKLVAATQEVQSANFNVSVNIGGDDELALLGREFNKMVEEIRIFDDMKIKKIAFERRKFDALANMAEAGIIVISVEGEILYMNRRLYEILGLTSERVLNVSIDDSPLPGELKSLFRESIERKDRFENRKWMFTYRRDDAEVSQSARVSLSPVRNHVGDIVNFVIALREGENSITKSKSTEEV